MSDEILRLQNLSIRAELPGGSVPLVENVSFAVARNRTTCLVGESGSGKTLTARAAMRLIDPPLSIDRESCLLLEDRDLMHLTERQMRQIRGTDIAMIFQEPMSYLNPVYTVGDQVAETLVWHSGMSRRAASARVEELFRLVGIPSPERRINQFPYELSGGMQQRVMIAMALACEPKLLIADEPTTALDVTIQAQILDLLGELQQRLGMAILLITHDLGVVAEMADNIVVMYAGAVVESGPSAQVLTQPRHPYTEALLNSTPHLGMRRDRRLQVIPGMVPVPGQRVAGCRFAPRCSYTFAACSKEPALSGGTHRTACWKSTA